MLNKNSESRSYFTRASTLGLISIELILSSAAHAQLINYVSVKDNGTQQGNFANDGATGTNSVAVGPGAAANGVSTIAIGDNAKALNSQDVAIGSGVVSNSNSGGSPPAIAIGGAGYITPATMAVGDGTIAIGGGTQVDGNYGIALGMQAGAGGANSIAIGNSAGIFSTNSSDPLFGKPVKSNDSIFIGKDAGKARGTSNSLADSNSENSNINLGSKSGAYGSGSNNFYGATLSGEGIIGDNNVAIGNSAANWEGLGSDPNTRVRHGTVSIGKNSDASNRDSIAVGSYSNARADSAIAIGNASTATAQNTIAIGAQATAQKIGDIALGANSVANQGAATYIGEFSKKQNTSVGTVSVGNVGGERTISNVADGRLGTDVVTVRQLQGAMTSISNSVVENQAGLDGRITNNETNINSIRNGASGMFQVNTDEISAAPLASGTNSAAGGAGAIASGKQSTAVGNSAAARGNASTAVGTHSQANAANSVALGAQSIATRDNTVSVGGSGNERQITNVAPGSAGTDAVNVNQLHSAQSNLANQIAEVRGDLSNLDNKLSAGVASAIAMAGLPQAYLPGKSMLSAAGGTWGGESGFAMGLSTVSGNGSWVLKGSASSSSRGDFGAAVGVGYQW